MMKEMIMKALEQMNCAVEIVCPFCGKTHFVYVNENDFEAWQLGELAQNAFPYLTPTEREQLISHICPECQEGIFGEEDEGDDLYICEMESLGGNWW